MKAMKYMVCVLDTSKVFDMVWHKGLLQKLEENGISGTFLKVLTDFLKSRRVVLNAEYLPWSGVIVGVS